MNDQYFRALLRMFSFNNMIKEKFFSPVLYCFFRLDISMIIINLSLLLAKEPQGSFIGSEYGPIH